MTHSQNSDSSAQIQSANDALLQQVDEQITLSSFEPTDQILKQLVAGLGDPRGLVRLRFAETLGEIGETATPFLLEALANHNDVVVRRAAAKTLTILADPVAVPTLLHSFLNDADLDVRKAAINSLGKTGDRSALKLLQPLLNDSQEVIRVLAKLAIAQIERQSEADDW